MTALRWFLLIVMWVLAGSFSVSALLFFIAAVAQIRKDLEYTVVFLIVFVMFAVLGAGAAYAALGVGRGLL